MKNPKRFKLIAGIFAALACSLFMATFAFCLEKPTPEQVLQYKADGIWAQRVADAESFGNHLVDPVLLERMHYNTQKQVLASQGVSQQSIDQLLAPPPAWRGMPTKGTVKVLVLLIAFADTAPISGETQAVVQSKIFGTPGSGFPYDSLTNYYQRASYNQLNIQGDVLGWYTTAYNRSSVTETYTGRESLIKEALNYYNSQGVDYSQYDNDGDGKIDYFAVVWTGTHGPWASFWWGYQTSFSDSSFMLDGKRLNKYSWQWESYSYPSGSFSPLVVIHETGHALGLPDLYDYDGSVGPDGGVGGLDMMDSNWGDHNCFSKYLMEWLTPTIVSSGSGTYTLRSSASTTDALLIMPGATSTAFGEFFMVQSRFREFNDTSYPTNGLLIWHIDSRLNGGNTNYIYDNSYAAHKLVRLMEADGLEQIEQNGSANTGDYYVAGKSFRADTAPNSSRYDGTASNVRIGGISLGSFKATFNAAINSGASDFRDFDGDRRSDVAVCRPAGHIWYALSSNTPGTYSSAQWGTAGDVPVPSDYNGDHKIDIAVFRPSSGIWYVLLSGTTGSYTTTQWGTGTDIAVPGDYDGDGKADIAVWRPGNGIWYVLKSGAPGTYTVTQWGVIADVPVPGDYDGDGKTDLAVWRPSSGVWYILSSSAPGSFTITQWGMATDTPVPGNYDSDAKTDIAVWRHDNGVWYVLKSSAPGTYATTAWGVDGDIPVVGDYDGDGMADTAVYRPNNGVWFILPSGSPSTYFATQWGDSNDVPVSGLTTILEQMP
jgi:M6 family metalloprotease-like protein